MGESYAEQLRQRNRELAILNSIAEALNREVDLDRALQVVMAQVADLLGLHTAWVWLLQDDGDDSYLAAARNLPPVLARNPDKMEGTCYCLDTFRDGDLAGAANVNVVTCTRLKNVVYGTEGLKYHASIPLYAFGKKKGVLNVASSDWRELSEDDLKLLYTVGDLLGIAVERAQLYGQSAQTGALEERNRLAREIHDTLAQGLTAITLQLESADALLESDADRARLAAVVKQALGLARSNLDEVRRSVMDLRAAPLEGQTLAQALEALAAHWRSRADLDIVLELVGGGRPLPVRMELGLYRVTQEALNNVAKHASATRVWVRLTTTPDGVELTVEDDGCGFDVSHAPEGRFGLVGLSERARLMGGELHLESDEGQGTRLTVTAPLGGRVA